MAPVRTPVSDEVEKKPLTRPFGPPSSPRQEPASLVALRNAPAGAVPRERAEKNRPKEHSLRRVKHTRGTTQIAAHHAAPSGSSKPYPLTRAHGRNWRIARPSGSEVMGFRHGSVSLHQTLTLCKNRLPNRLRHSLFRIADTVSCSYRKVKCFSAVDKTLFYVTKFPARIPPKNGETAC